MILYCYHHHHYYHHSRYDMFCGCDRKQEDFGLFITNINGYSISSTFSTYSVVYIDTISIHLFVSVSFGSSRSLLYFFACVMRIKKNYVKTVMISRVSQFEVQLRFKEKNLIYYEKLKANSY